MGHHQPTSSHIMTNRTQQLCQLMTERNLSAEDVAKLLNRSVQTVYMWRCESSGRDIPEHTLELLRAKSEPHPLAKQIVDDINRARELVDHEIAKGPPTHFAGLGVVK